MDEELSKAIEDGVVGPKADPKEPGGMGLVWQRSDDCSRFLMIFHWDLTGLS